MASVLRGFKDFVLRGNVVDLAVAVVIGAAFGAVVTALVKDIITPLVAVIFGEHDFGALTVAGVRLLWKIDYYDAAMAGGSPDPADPSVTTRVLTVMLAHEW